MWVFGFFALIFSLAIIFVGNPIYAIISLIFVFICIGGILFIIGCEFIAVIFLIVYVGAIGVLFLFVVMMLNIKITELSAVVWRTISIGLLFFALFLFLILWAVFSTVSYDGLWQEYVSYEIFFLFVLNFFSNPEPTNDFYILNLVGGINYDYFFKELSLLPYEYFKDDGFSEFFKIFIEELSCIQNSDESVFVPNLPIQFDNYEEFIFLRDSLKSVKFFTFFKKDGSTFHDSTKFETNFSDTDNDIDLTIPIKQELTPLQELFFNGWGITTPYDKNGNWTGIFLGIDWQKLYPGSTMLIAARLRLPPESFWQVFIIYDAGLGRPPLWWQVTYKFWWHKIQRMSSGFSFLELVARHYENRANFYWGIPDLDTWSDTFIPDDWKPYCRYMVQDILNEEILDENGYPKMIDPNFLVTKYNLEHDKFKNFGKDYLERMRINNVNIYIYFSQFKDWELEEMMRVSGVLMRRHLPASPSWISDTYSGCNGMNTAKSMGIYVLDWETLTKMRGIWLFTRGTQEISRTDEILSWQMDESNREITRYFLLGLLNRLRIGHSSNLTSAEILSWQMDESNWKEMKLFFLSKRPQYIMLKELKLVDDHWFSPIYSNTEFIGWILYTYNFKIFLIIGLILLVAMIGSIVLVLNQNINIQRQIIFNQVMKNLSNSIALKTKN